MLLRERDGAAVAIGQAAHAWLSGQLARRWGNERFGAVTPREEVCLAAEQHDVGMAQWDLEPTLNPATGRPHSFLEMPIETHLSLWGEAPRRLYAQSRYAALLVSMHGTALYERRDLSRLERRQADAVRTYLDGQRRLQQEIVRQLRADPGTSSSATDELVRRNQRLVFAWDFLSLALCLDWPPRRLDGVPAATGTTALSLEPAGPAGPHDGVPGATGTTAPSLEPAGRERPLDDVPAATGTTAPSVEPAGRERPLDDVPAATGTTAPSLEPACRERPLDDVPAATGTTAPSLEPAGRERPLDDVPAGPVRAAVDPWPFADAAVTVRTEGRVLRERFDDESEMRAALAAAPWITLEFALVPA